MESALFNPKPDIRPFYFKTGEICWVIDDVLVNPEALLTFAITQRDQFQQAPFNAYPGLEFPMPDSISAKLNSFFTLHMRRYFHTRRLLQMNSRMAMVTLAPEDLQARQWICHRDSAWIDPQHCIVASVLYLFKDENLGGTQFFAPQKPMPEIERLVHDASTLSNEAFSAKHGIYPGYYTGSDIPLWRHPRTICNEPRPRRRPINLEWVFHLYAQSLASMMGASLAREKQYRGVFAHRVRSYSFVVFVGA
jgi:Family of unknown function (DUF6445)